MTSETKLINQQLQYLYISGATFRFWMKLRGEDWLGVMHDALIEVKAFQKKKNK